MTELQRERWSAIALVVGAVIFRAGIFVFWERAHFDADQAVMGLMAKHLAEGRALPVFFYGQYYILGVEAWLAAPLFALAGASVTVLKLPLLGINIAIALLLLRGFTRDAGLRPLVAVVPALFFALPAAGTAVRFVAPDGGNVEPILYGLLLWFLRDRPVWCGLILGVGFLHREFTVYPFLALLIIQALRRELLTRRAVIRTAVTIGVAAAVWVGVQGLKRVSSAGGPGTTIAHVHGPASNLAELAARTCFAAGTLGSGAGRIATDHWPTLFGTATFPLNDFGIVSRGVYQGIRGSGVLLAAVIGLAVVMIVAGIVRAGGVAPRHDFCAFLLLSALISVAGYVVGRCGAIDFYLMRYELWSVAGAAGLGAWALSTIEHTTTRRFWIALALAWFAVTAVPHVQLWRQYLTDPPADIRRQLIAELDARGIRYGSSRYWVSYVVTFLTDERIILKSNDFIRVWEYQWTVDAHAGEAVRIERDPCPGGEEVLPRVYLCR